MDTQNQNQDYELLEKYASYHYGTLRKAGFQVERDEVWSALGLALVEAQVNWQKSNPNGVSWSTYLIQAFKNMVASRVVPALAKEAALARRRDFRDPDEFPDESALSYEDAWEIEEFVNSLEGRTRLIARELYRPSEAVVGAVRRFVEKRAVTPGRRAIDGIGDILSGISEVYGFSIRSIRHEVKKIRLVAEKRMTRVSA